MASRGCNLECVTGEEAGNEVIEFMGPVKIILVDQPRNLYMRKRFAAAAIVLSHMMMGATNMTVLYYTLSYEKETCLSAMHIVLGTVGYQLCMPSAILALHKLTGSTAVMRLPHRPFEHVLLHTMAVTCGVFGAGASFIFGTFKVTFHSVTGIAVAILAIANVMFGFMIYDFKGTRLDIKEMGPAHLKLHKIHKFLGMFAFMLSSLCFISGLAKPTLVSWMPAKEILHISILFCVFYTAVILYKPLKEH